ncbi:peptidase S49 [Marichromatium purpuratum 984]|uniref:Peptidase S49 n=1 Tax=Marichromatium purpuratum 984 TaxID=765910 RepID=W0DXK1_MARPU|nr:S49 family peptidase [Marichromatium purpuratum]AHF03157.1 peptidase S49 [Marichromatium purpuratum 984]
MQWRFWKRWRKPPMPDPDQPGWERALINHLALDYMRERRRTRRWGLVLKLLILLYLVGLVVAASVRDWDRRMELTEPHAALIEIDGVIAADSDASADRVVGALRKAFDNDKVEGVILRINSPGGSPVQAGYINDEIARLKAKYREAHDGEDLPVYAVAADLCASGGYYIAVGADAIYADKASLVGSIGVRIGSFGLDRLLVDLGIERRLLTAGANKGILDPFSPLPESQRVFIQGVLDTLHQQFIAEVREGRGDRLQGGEELFSGLFWSGEQALELGLIDGLASAGTVAREQLGTETVVDYTQKRDLLDSFAERLGGGMAGALGALFGGLDAGVLR